MKKALICALITTAVAGVAAQKDPVALSVNGKDIKLSEFEYYYKKNKQQQVETTSFDDYVNMFVNYKLNVAAAEDAGLDTTKTFKREYEGLCNEMAKPYIVDNEVKSALEQEAYKWIGEDVDISYIVLPPLDKETGLHETSLHMADSIHSMLERGDSFEILVLRYSADSQKVRNGGRIGYFPFGRIPYLLEKAAHNTEVGKFSDVIDTPYGIFIIKVNDRKAHKEVSSQHILKLIPQNATSEQVAAVKAQIDSIYTVVTSGADFSQVAMQESQDEGSAVKGGQLPWFGVGQFVQEFQDAAFAMNVGDISKPVRTAYGFHIIKKLDEKGAPSFDEALPTIQNAIANDERSLMPRSSYLNNLKVQYGFKLDDAGMELLRKSVVDGKLDSAYVASLCGNNSAVATFKDQVVTVADVAKSMQRNVDKASFGNYVDIATTSTVDAAVEKYAIAHLSETNVEYRNMINEYREGIISYEVQNKNVWSKGNTDIDGLTKYFEANRSKYNWEKPKYKGLLIQAESDSVADLAKARLVTISGDSVATALKKEFKRAIKIERVLVAEGDNKLVDACEFGKDAPDMSNDRFKAFFTYGGKMITEPEDLYDTKSEVVMDYQNYLMDQWKANLRSKYKVKLKKNVLKKVSE